MAGRPGIAIVNVLVFAVFTTAFLIAGVSFTHAAIKQGRKTNSNVQVYNVALAGITHAVFWMQKQTVQPVLKFDPRENGPSVPDEEPETKDEELGLMGEFAIDSANKIYGRYEVARSANAPARPPEVPNPGPSCAIYGSTPITWAAEDISGAKGEKDKPGTIWRVRCRAYTFTRDNASIAFNLADDGTVKIKETLTLEAEVKAAPLKFRNAALYGFGTGMSGADADFVENNSTKPRVEVGDTASAARGYHLRTNDINNLSNLETADSGAASGYNDSTISTTLSDQLAYVFGVGSLGEVKNMANSYYEAIADVPADLSTMSFVYLKGNFSFGSSKPLLGSGILFVEGDLSIDGNSKDQSWEGLIFTTGKFTLKKNAVVTGAVMAGGNIKLESDGSSKQAKITYSDSQLKLVADTLGSYRMERSTLRSVPDANSSQYTF